MLTAPQLIALLKSHGLRLTKRLGQHHLIDARIAARIVEAAHLGPDDTVVEIGSGLGALTERLAQRALRVIAVEIDRRIAALLAERMRGVANVSIVRQDILTFPWKDMDRVQVIGTIPYHITSPLLVLLSEHRASIHQAVLVVQREVAERLCAKPGTKAYGRLSVLGQYSWELSSCFTIPPSAFFPPPEVSSTCLRLASRASPPVAVEVEDEAVFFSLVRAAFSHRRKTLLNCLRSYMSDKSPDELEVLLRRLGLDPRVRGETLTLDQFAQLANHLR